MLEPCAGRVNQHLRGGCGNQQSSACRCREGGARVRVAWARNSMLQTACRTRVLQHPPLVARPQIKVTSNHLLQSSAGWNFLSAPVQHDFEKSCPPRPCTLPARTRPADHPKPRLPRIFSVSNPHLSENYYKLRTIARFFCNEIVRNMHLYLTKVAVKSGIYAKAFYTTVVYSTDLFTCNAEYRETLSGENGDHLPTVCVSCWDLAPHCMKLLGNFTIWPTVLDWCLAGSFLQLLLGYYSVQTGYQREHNYTEIVLKHVFLNNTFTFCAIGLIDKSCV